MTLRLVFAAAFAVVLSSCSKREGPRLSLPDMTIDPAKLKVEVSLADNMAMQSCVESLCGPDGPTLATPMQEAALWSSKQPDAFDRELGPLLQKIVEEEKMARQARAERVDKWLRTNPVLKNPLAIRIYNLFRVVGEASRFHLDPSPVGVMVNYQKSRDRFPELSEEEFSRHVMILNFALKFINHEEIPLRDSAVTKIFFPGDQLQKKIDEAIATVQKKAEDLQKVPEFLFATRTASFQWMVSPEQLRERFVDDPASAAGIARLNQVMVTVTTYLAVIQDANFRGLLSSDPIDMAEEARRSNLLAQLQEQAANPPDWKKAGTCRLAFSMGQALLPSAAELSRIDQRTRGLKADLLRKITDRMPHSSGILNEEASKWNISLSPSREEHLTRMKVSFEKTLKRLQLWRKEEDDYLKSLEIDSVNGLEMAAAVFETSEGFFRDLCGAHIFQPVGDTAVFNSGFMVGPFSMKGDSLGQGISEHELAHMVYGVLRQKTVPTEAKDWFQKSRQCLVQNHTEMTSEERTNEISKLLMFDAARYEMEDWADMVAAHAGQQGNFACLLARKAKTEDYASVSLTNPIPEDPHSSDLFRLLHMHYIRRGEIPKACESALALRGQRAQFKNCFTEAMK